MLHVFRPEVGGYPAVYAGRTGDLRRRLLEHLRGASAKPFIRRLRRLQRMYFSAAPVLDADLLPRVEACLVRALEPVGNDQVPADEPVLVDLPPLSLREVLR